MDKPCPKYIKFLSKHKDDFNKCEERLTFPSRSDRNIDEFYCSEKNLDHTVIFDKKFDITGNCSEMKYQYSTPMLSLIKDTIGVRKQTIKNKYWRQFSTEMLREDKRNVSNNTNIYESEYSSNYAPGLCGNIKNFKYPLYGTGSSPATFYTNYHGCTKGNNILEPCRKVCHFSKPLDERMDKEWIL